MKKKLVTILIFMSATTVFISCGKDNNNIEDNTTKVEDNTTKVEDNIHNEEQSEEIQNDENIQADTDINISEDRNDSITAGDDEGIIYESNEELILEYARILGQNYYDYEVNTNMANEIDGIKLYYFAIHLGPPNNELNEYMLGDDGHLYDYQMAVSGILELIK